jgi:hypothetical protein
MWERDLDQAALFGGMLMGNKAMAEFYRLKLPVGTGFEELAPDRDQRRFGILTLPAVLATLANGADSSPVRRGKFIVSEILCRPLPGPPAGVIPPAPEMLPGQTTRDRYAAHMEEPACRFCHAQMDPVGFGLENYDGYGRWRMQDNGAAVDPSGTGELLGKAFEGPAGLAEILAGSDEVSQCLVSQWFRFAVGRAVDPVVDACTISQLKAAFVAGGRRLRPLLVAIATSDAFLTRRRN